MSDYFRFGCQRTMSMSMLFWSFFWCPQRSVVPDHSYKDGKRKSKNSSYKSFYRTMIFWFFTAAMIESFNLWRWNYGPYKEPVNHAGHSGQLNFFMVSNSRLHSFNSIPSAEHNVWRCSEFKQSALLPRMGSQTLLQTKTAR